MAQAVMEPVEPETQDRLLKLLRKHKKRLRAYPGVHRVDIGYAYRRGRPTKQLAIRVHVHKKRPESALKPGEILPKSLDGVRVDVLETNPEPHLVNRKARQNPFMPGVEIRNTVVGGVGTLGGIVFDRDRLAPMGLSNNHVLLGTGGARGDVVNQPGTTAANDRVGQVIIGNSFYDAAVFRIDRPGLRPFTLNVADLPGRPRITGTAAVRIGLPVVKSGRTTATTFGIVDGVDDVFEFTAVGDPANPASSGQISMPGDSGSVWCDAATNRAAGLHYAGEASGTDRAWAKRISGVLDKLDVLFLDRAALSRVYIGFYAFALGQATPSSSCNLKIIYPSGRVSTAKGLGANTADSSGFVRWAWRVGTETHRHDPKYGRAEFTLDGQVIEVPFLPKQKQVITP
jgi:hypothetical protein